MSKTTEKWESFVDTNTGVKKAHFEEDFVTISMIVTSLLMSE